MSLCEKCGQPHDGTYASGRFCNSKCSRGFSTSKNREEINKKVSLSLGGDGSRERICPTCNSVFKGRPSSRKKYCCKKCDTSREGRVTSNETKEKISKARTEALLAGKGRSSAIRCWHTFRGTEIRCDSKLEYACLDWFTKNYQIEEMGRCPLVIGYFYKGIQRRYIPDFLIQTEASTFLVEVKSEYFPSWLSPYADNYADTAVLKKEALEAYCQENNLTPFWFSQKTHERFYRRLKVPEEAFQSQGERDRLAEGIAKYQGNLPQDGLDWMMSESDENPSR